MTGSDALSLDQELAMQVPASCLGVASLVYRSLAEIARLDHSRDERFALTGASMLQAKWAEESDKATFIIVDAATRAMVRANTRKLMTRD